MSNEVHERSKTSITTPSDTEIRIERIFDAPRQLVWDAYHDPELIPEWLGPRELATTVEQLDFRAGGSYRFVHTAADGSEFAFFGDFREIAEPEYVVRTFGWEGMPGKQSVERADFEELEDGRTRIVIVSTFESKEDRDGMIESGMEHGVNASFERLDDVLARRKTS